MYDSGSPYDEGYGDRLSWSEIEEIVRRKERFTQILVSERVRDTNLRDDVLNEVRITIWRVLSKRPDAPDAYIHAAMKMRITEVMTRGVWTGMEGHRGMEIDPIRRTDRDSLDDPDWDVVVRADDVIEKVLMAYHDGEILDAIRALPRAHQEYVVQRFWGGLTHAEIRALATKPLRDYSELWTERIRPRLREQLHHLQEAMA